MITIILPFFVLLLLINIVYWYILNRQLRRHVDDPRQSNSPKITILICVKNETNRLLKLIQNIDNQRSIHNDINILIVNDYSGQVESEWLETLTSRYPIKIIKPSADIPGKKAALISGLDAIDHGLILMTDADCVPRAGWIDHMASATMDGMTLGYSPLTKEDTYVNVWARYENVITAIQYLGWANLLRPYMGVGRNLAVTKSSIENLTIEDLKPDIPSGDDDMLVQYVGKTNVRLHSDAYVDTEAPPSWRSYFLQKRRHYGISTDYPLMQKLLLSLFSISQIGILLLGILLMISGHGMIVISLLGLRLLVLMVSSRSVFRKLEQDDLWYRMPILDVMLSLHYLVFGFTFLLPKSSKW